MRKTGGWNPPMHKGRKDYWREEEVSWQSSASPADRSPAHVRSHRSLHGYACVACRVQKHILVQRRRERRTRWRCLRFRSRLFRSAHGDRNPAKSNQRQQTQQPANPHGLHSSPLNPWQDNSLLPQAALYGSAQTECMRGQYSFIRRNPESGHPPSTISPGDKR